MENRFELAFDDVLAANQSGKTRNLLITDNNDEFRNSALKALYHWSEKNGIRVVEIDEDDESWMDLIPLLELYKQLNTVKTVLLVKNYATYLFRSSNPNTARSFIRNIALERSYTKDSSTSLELPNLLFVIAINDLSEMYWKEAEYSSFSIIHEDEDKCTWVNTKFTRPDTQMHPVMTRVNKAIYFVSDDETTICIDVGEAFKGVRLKNPIRSLRPTLEDKIEILHAYIESNLPEFHNHVECLILKTDRFGGNEHFVIDGKRLKQSFPNLSVICCKNMFQIADSQEEFCIIDPFEIGELSFNLAQDGDIAMANSFVRDLWALDRSWAKFFREVARDYYRKPEDHTTVDNDSVVHHWTGMDNLFRIYLLGWYHAGDDFFDEEDRVVVGKYKNTDKALDLLPVRFQNCSVDEVADKLYWDLRHLKESRKPDYLLFEQVLEEAEKICPGVLVKMRYNGWICEDFETFFPIRTCNMCGKTFDYWDHEENILFDHFIGYGSAHDMHRIRLNLCCKCFDKVVDWILPQCKHNPMSEYQ